MKTTILALLPLTALMLVLPATGRAQDIQWGVKGGLNVSGLRGGGGLFDTKRGVVAGGFGVFDFAPEFGIEVDALFMMKGGKSIGYGVDQTGKVTGPINEGFFILDYLEFPILARLNTPAMGRLSPHVYVGPTLALKLSARAQNSGFSGTNLDGARSLDSGLAFGVSGDLALGTRTLVLDARAGVGLTNALGWAGPDLKNDTFSIMAGIAF
jgi:hypothetical protein